MGFKELNLKYYYNNDRDDLVNEFYKPVLKNSIKYKRAIGFFSSSSFWMLIEGLRDFLNRDGKIQLLVSPNLSKENIESIKIGEKTKENLIEGFLISKILEEDKYKDQFNLLALLIYEKKLEIKIVIKKNFNEYDIFRDKFAIMEDEDKRRIGFNDYLNDSETSILKNFESINVFNDCNESDLCRINDMDRLFNSVWENLSKKWISFNIPDSIKKKILEKISKSTLKIENKEICIKDRYQLRDYQKEAMNNWINNNCKGILEMATGSGKTLTAIFSIIKVIELFKMEGYPCGVVIVVPYKTLLEQWCEELKKFNIYPIRCYENKNLWYSNANIKIFDFNKYDNKNLFLITTNTTYISNEFQCILYKIKRNYIFCVDEMHHLLAPTISKLLPENTDIRLGLTATLGNDYEQEKVKQIKKYFSDIVFSFTLKDAIENNCLTKYYYYPIFIELTSDEIEDYINLSNKIGKFIHLDENEQLLKILINKRRRIIFNAKNKIIKFSAMEDEIKKYNKTLVYCGDKIDDDGRFVNKVNKIIYDMGIRTHTYTSELKRKERLDILEKFKSGDIEVLTAIRCLDEGVDIPSLDCAFILSSNMDSKQFIQRRGRILRKYNGKKFAYIYDFIVIPTLNKDIIKKLDYETKEIQKKIVTKELNRVYEFASLCENKMNVLSEIVNIIKLYS